MKGISIAKLFLKGCNLIGIFLMYSFLGYSQMVAVKTTPSVKTIPENNDIILEINHFAYTIANQHDQFYSFKGVRALAMTHLAIHDILNARQRQYTPYLFDRQVATFDPITAIIESTRNILNTAYPERKDTIEEICDRWLVQAGTGAAQDEGLLLGGEVARLYIRHRANDGHEKNGDYTPMTKPGDYRYTPGFDWVWKPDFSVARPFMLDSVSQFRSPPPPGLTSAEYAASFNEVKKIGVRNSQYRTKDQTSIAHWWAEFGEHCWNRIGRITAKKRQLPLMEANRMFALLNMNLYDLYLASFESKYHYDTWRPITAIIQGESDGNSDTAGQPDWEPEMVTPPWPEYPSAHASVGAAGAEIVSEIFGTPKISFTMESVTALADARMRTYHDLREAARDCAESRILNGYHFRFATEEGAAQGRKLAQYALSHFLAPVESK
jgi:hypothetical protein